MEGRTKDQHQNIPNSFHEQMNFLRQMYRNTNRFFQLTIIDEDHSPAATANGPTITLAIGYCGVFALTFCIELFPIMKIIPQDLICQCDMAEQGPEDYCLSLSTILGCDAAYYHCGFKRSFNDLDELDEYDRSSFSENTKKMMTVTQSLYRSLENVRSQVVRFQYQQLARTTMVRQNIIYQQLKSFRSLSRSSSRIRNKDQNQDQDQDHSWDDLVSFMNEEELVVVMSPPPAESSHQVCATTTTYYHWISVPLSPASVQLLFQFKSDNTLTAFDMFWSKGDPAAKNSNSFLDDRMQSLQAHMLSHQNQQQTSKDDEHGDGCRDTAAIPREVFQQLQAIQWEWIQRQEFIRTCLSHFYVIEYDDVNFEHLYFGLKHPSSTGTDPHGSEITILQAQLFESSDIRFHQLHGPMVLEIQNWKHSQGNALPIQSIITRLTQALSTQRSMS